MQGNLNELAEGVWIADSPHSFYGLQLGTRMTVVRLSSGEVLLHSPISIDAELREAIDGIGPVKHIVCPNMFHHMHAGEAVRSYPTALLHGPEKLHRKRKDLRFHGILSEVPHADWKDDLLPITIRGSIVRETVLYHEASRTLITSDLVENFKSHTHAPTRIYLRLGGLLGHAGWHPLMRLVYLDRRAARASIQRILSLPFERVVIAHGDVITTDAIETVRKGLAWL